MGWKEDWVVQRYTSMANAIPCNHGWPVPEDCPGYKGTYLKHPSIADIKYAREILMAISEEKERENGR